MQRTAVTHKQSIGVHREGLLARESGVIGKRSLEEGDI